MNLWLWSIVVYFGLDLAAIAWLATRRKPVQYTAGGVMCVCITHMFFIITAVYFATRGTS